MTHSKTMKSSNPSRNSCEKYKTTLQSHLSRLEKAKDKKSLFRTYLGFAEKTIQKIKKECPDLEISKEEQQLASLKDASTTSQSENANNDAEYFKRIYTRLNYVYNQADLGADGAKGLQFFSTHKNLEEAKALYGNFSKSAYLAKVEESKRDGTYAKHRFFIDKTIRALEDYPRFINNSANTFQKYLAYLNNVGVKGDTQQELKHLNAAKDFCSLLLRFAPDNPKASAWLRQVEKQIQSIAGSITYASKMHEEHLGQMLFSNRVVAIGNETAADFTSNFKSGDFIFATIYLPSKLRER